MNKTPLAQELYDKKVLHEDFLRRNMQRERILRRALRNTPKGDPKAREY
ncbi:MAG: hypothetical protein ABIJ57_13235 [Pseudomonadota bacterium]